MQARLPAISVDSPVAAERSAANRTHVDLGPAVAADEVAAQALKYRHFEKFPTSRVTIGIIDHNKRTSLHLKNGRRPGHAEADRALEVLSQLHHRRRRRRRGRRRCRLSHLQFQDGHTRVSHFRNFFVTWFLHHALNNHFSLGITELQFLFFCILVGNFLVAFLSCRTSHHTGVKQPPFRYCACDNGWECSSCHIQFLFLEKSVF